MTSNESLSRSQLHTFFSRHNVLNLCYIDTGVPAACAVWFAAVENLELFYVSSYKTRHGNALRHGGKIAFTVQKDEQGWRQIEGVQGDGYCSPVAPEHRGAAWQAYSRRFPFVLQPFADVAQALSAITLWSIQPTWMRLIDNSKGFGHKEELRLTWI